MTDQPSLTEQLQELVQMAQARGLLNAADLVSRILECQRSPLRFYVLPPDRAQSQAAPSTNIARAEEVDLDAAIEDLEDELRQVNGPPPVAAALALARLLVGESSRWPRAWQVQVRKLFEAALLHGWHEGAPEPFVEIYKLARTACPAERADTLERVLEPLLRCSDRRVAEPAHRYIKAGLRQREGVAQLVREHVARELQRRRIFIDELVTGGWEDEARA